jgi:hypothetical protein
MGHTPVFRGNNGLAQEILLLLFEGDLRKILWVFLCNHIHPKAALAFLVGSSMAGHDSQRVKKCLHFKNGDACLVQGQVLFV